MTRPGYYYTVIIIMCNLINTHAYTHFTCLVAEEESRSGLGDYSPKSLPRLLRKVSIVLSSHVGLLFKGACHDAKTYERSLK